MHVCGSERDGGGWEIELYIRNSVTKIKDRVLIFIYNLYFQIKLKLETCRKEQLKVTLVKRSEMDRRFISFQVSGN